MVLEYLAAITVWLGPVFGLAWLLHLGERLFA